MKSKTTRFMSRILAIILIGVAGYGLRASSLQVPSSGTWAPAPGALLEARSGAAAATLPDGRVLITGGEAGGSALASAELFNADGSFSPAAPMSFARSGHTAVALADGRVLVAGGVTLDGGSTNSAELYDPVSDSWSPAGAMLEARSGHTATLLEDGRVLIAGGEHAGAASFSLELFDPVSNTFAPAGTMLAARTGHAAAALPEGKVLLTGGLPAQAGSDGTNPQATTEIYDSASGVVVPGPEMAFARAGHSATALLTGDVLVAGGSNGAEDLASAEVYSAGSGTFFLVSSSLTTPRSGHLAVRLPHNNSVLLAGGTSGGAAVSSAELYRPWSESFVSTGSMGEVRAAAASAAAGEGVLLVAGGCSAGDCSAGLSTGGSSALATAELYGFATVKTDKDDYAPGETVTITGSGWEPGETVSLLLHEVDNPDPHEDRTLTAVADEAGYIFNNEFAPEEHDIGVRFYLTASGSRSQAQTTFTDALRIDVERQSPTAASFTVASGATFSVQFRIRNQNTAGDAGTLLGGTYTLTATGLTLLSGPSTSGSFSGLSGASPSSLIWNFQAPTGPASRTITLSATITSPPCSAGGGSQCTASASYGVTVSAPSDTTPPVVTVPANMTVEATSSAGAVVTFSATANDDVDGALTPVCSPASGSTFALGTTTVTCTATDAAGNTGSASFTITVVDTTPPTLSLPADITAEATGPTGAVVTYTATASDLVDGSVAVSCSPASGSTFALGTTTVTCTATDAAGNTGSASFTITVVDTTPPTLSLPADITAEATGPTGAVVTYTATAEDLVDMDPDVVCTPPSGSTFPLGVTTVNCTATDDSGNSSTGSFTITVVDTTPPALFLPSDMTVEGNTTGGAIVTFTATASDLVDGPVSVACTPASGSFFPLGGPTTVNCSATDAAGNTANGSFNVTVIDTTAPTLTVPADLVVPCTKLDGTGRGCADATDAAIAAWLASASATDIVDATPTITHNAPSIFPVGFTVVTFTATDDSGNSATGTAKVQVVYSFAGFLAPLMKDGIASIQQGKQGRTIPVKFQLFCNGTPVGSAVATISVFKLLDAAVGTVDTTDYTADSGSSNNNGNLFRYDALSQQYIYNLSTKGFPAPATYRIFVTLDDGTQYHVDFSLR